MSTIQLVGLDRKDLDFLHEKSLKELQVIAKDNGLKPVTGLRKQTLIDRILEIAGIKKQAELEFGKVKADHNQQTKSSELNNNPDKDDLKNKGLSKYKKKALDEGLDHQKNDARPDITESKLQNDINKKVEPVNSSTPQRTHTQGKQEIPNNQANKQSAEKDIRQHPNNKPKAQKPPIEQEPDVNNTDVSRNQSNNKKKKVYDQLPDSDAVTLDERLADITPKLGGFLINEGTLEILPDGYGFLRSVNYHYMASPDDIYVSPSQIKRFCLKQGDCVVGVIRPPKVGERYFALLRVDGVNGYIPKNMDERKDFESLLPIYPEKRYKLENNASEYTTRMIDLFAPVGMGQRGLIVAQPKTGKTTILRNIANAVKRNAPHTKIIIMMVDERPEEVTEMERSVIEAEVVASTFDQKPENHINLATLVFQKVKRLVESGHDVLLLLDSLTRLARSYNITASNSGRTMSGGIDTEALKIPRQMFSSARNIENGGSLTIIATALVDTGSRMDDVIFEEFKGTGNMEIVLDRRLSDRRIFPAIDVFKSGTRKEELIVPDSEREKVVLLRRYLSSMSPNEAMEFLLNKMKGTRSNEEFLISMNQ
ncbi:MAG: transcription termination factor Rho [Balneolales bacterium]